jgi:transcriptional regulator with XRE-family HTH domain
MYDDFQIISANLKYLREKSGYTQEQLAEITGLSVSHISKVEAGLRRVGMKTYISILHTNILVYNEDGSNLLDNCPLKTEYQYGDILFLVKTC